MLVDDADARWTVVHCDDADPMVRKYPVPGGFLYQVSVENALYCKSYGTNAKVIYDFDKLRWHPPVFVSKPPKGT